MSIVKIKNLTKKFGNLIAVNNISLEINKGEIFGLLGPNGSGKTTLTRMLCGILIPSSGSAEVLGYDIYREPEKIKKSIGYMSQKFSIYEDLTVEENLKFYSGIYLSSIDMDKIQEVKELLDLEDKKDIIVATLSGGWKQRVALACAICHQPPLLFLDEPTAGVDPLSRRKFWNNLHLLSQRGTTIIVTTHYMDEASQCHRLGFMFNGKLIALGTPEEIKQKEGLETLEEVFISLVNKGNQKEGAINGY